MPHIGEIVYKTFHQMGFSKAEIAKAIGMSRHGLYRQLEKADMKISYVLKIGEYIGVDFLEMIPSLKKEVVEVEEFKEQEDREPYPSPEPVSEPLEITIKLDGTPGTLERLIQRLRAVNQAIQPENP